MNSKKSTTPTKATPTALHRELAEQVCRLIHSERRAIGTRFNEKRLAEQLGVSRTPVRAALQHLADRGFVVRRPNLGMELVALPPPPATPATATATGDTGDDALLLRIARDRQQGRLSDDVSEKDLMDNYGLGRPALRQALERLADLGVVERKLGYGWRFSTEAWDRAARQEGYRFRMVIEPAAIREPGFLLPPQWATDMLQRHNAFLQAPWEDSSSVAFFEMNAAFHEGVAAASGNRYFVAAIERQNRLRRLTNWDWRHGRERVEVNCREHIEILQRLQSGDREIAALLMQRHLEIASRLRAKSPGDFGTID